MKLFRLPTAILLLTLILILGFLIFIKQQSSTQEEDRSVSKIPIFQRSPSPSQLTPYNQLTEEEKLNYQSIADDNYTKAQDAVLSTYPWYNYFPISDKNYFVYFDPDQKQFIALLYPQKTSMESINDQVRIFKEIITDRLRNIDPKTLNLPIKWEVKEE